MKNISKRTIYFFKCIKCKKERRVTLKAEKAIDQLCRTCRKNQISKDQISIFDDKNV